MEVIKTAIDGVFILEPRIFNDARGYFFESFSGREFEEKVCRTTFVQDNESFSTYGVLRGLHFQTSFHSKQTGACDQGSGTGCGCRYPERFSYFRKACGCRIDRRESPAVFYPRGFAHGFAVLSDEVLFQYKCDHYYAPQSEGGIAWDDPDLGIDWRLPADKVILSDKDKKHPRLKDYQTDFDFNQSLY